MDIKEKQILVTAINLVVIFTCYSLYVYTNYVAKDFGILNDFKFWGTTFLILIPVTIFMQILIHILFAIINKIVTNEDIPPHMNDERDKLIDLKAKRISHWIFTAGFLLAMATQVLSMPPYVMFITMIISGFASGVVSEMAKLYFYRRGF